MENKNTFEKFVNDYKETLDANKQISLYNLLLKKCPNSIKKLNKKIYGPKYIPFLDKEKKWYTVFINYLTINNILEVDRRENGTYHNVTDDYKDYFIHSVSTVFAPKNHENHLILYSQTADDFLSKSGILNSDGSEFVKGPENKNKKNSFFAKYSKQINIASSILMFITVANYIFMISNYGLHLMTPFLSNTCLFTLSVILSTTKFD